MKTFQTKVQEFESFLWRTFYLTYRVNSKIIVWLHIATGAEFLFIKSIQFVKKIREKKTKSIFQQQKMKNKIVLKTANDLCHASFDQ